MHRHWNISRAGRLGRVIGILFALSASSAMLGGGVALAVDTSLNITKISEFDPLHPNVFPDTSTHIYGDIWVDGNYAYVGSDVNGGGVSVFDISVPSNPVFIRNQADPGNPLDPIAMPTYAGHQFEDIEVYNGIAYIGSDVSTSSGTGVDIVDFTNPENPVLLKQINSNFFPSSQVHNKVHTLSVSDGFLYTTENSAANATDVIQIWDVGGQLGAPDNPQHMYSVDLGLASGQSAHEVVVKNGLMYVASKNNNYAAGTGFTTIYDVSNLATTEPLKIKKFDTGAGTHTSMVSADGNLLVVAQERPSISTTNPTEVRLYDISMLEPQENGQEDPDTPILLSTLTEYSVGISAYSPHHPHLHGDMLFLSWYDAGLQVFNIADPANPVRTGFYDTFSPNVNDYNGNWGNFIQLNAEGNLQNVFLSDRDRGLIVLDVSDAASTGDFNQDNIVDGADFLAWQRNLGVTSNATLAMGDGNRDKKVSGLDLDVWKFQFGEDGSHHAVTAVPEGSSLCLAAIGMLAAGSRFRRELRRGDARGRRFWASVFSNFSLNQTGESATIESLCRPPKLPPSHRRSPRASGCAVSCRPLELIARGDGERRGPSSWSGS